MYRFSLKTILCLYIHHYNKIWKLSLEIISEVYFAYYKYDLNIFCVRELIIFIISNVWYKVLRLLSIKVIFCWCSSSVIPWYNNLMFTQFTLSFYSLSGYTMISTPASSHPLYKLLCWLSIVSDLSYLMRNISVGQTLLAFCLPFHCCYY